MRASVLLLVAVVLAVCAAMPAASSAREPSAPQPAWSVAGGVRDPGPGEPRDGAELAGVRAPDARIARPLNVLGVGLKVACGVICIGVDLLKKAGKKAADVAGDIAAGVLDQLAAGIADGGAFMMRKTARMIQRTTTPALTARWFRERYDEMRRVAVLFAALAFLAAVITAIVTRNGNAMLMTVGLRLPLAFGLTAALCVITQMAVEVADTIAADFATSFQTDSAAVMRTGAHGLLGLVAVGGSPPVVPAIIAIVLALFGIASAFVLWLELLVRDAGIYVVVFLAPLVCAAMIWERCVPLLTRTLWILFALIMSKPLIVALMSLGGSGLADGVPEQGLSVVLTVLVLLLLSCLTPWALLSLVPLLEGYSSHRARRSLTRLGSAPASAATMGGRGAMQALMNDHFGSRGTPAAGSSPATSGTGSGSTSASFPFTASAAASAGSGVGPAASAAAGSLRNPATRPHADTDEEPDRTRTGSNVNESKPAGARSAPTHERDEPPAGTGATAHAPAATTSSPMPPVAGSPAQAGVEQTPASAMSAAETTATAGPAAQVGAAGGAVDAGNEPAVPAADQSAPLDHEETPAPAMSAETSAASGPAAQLGAAGGDVTVGEAQTGATGQISRPVPGNSQPAEAHPGAPIEAAKESRDG
jgi:hypothetical protein